MQTADDDMLFEYMAWTQKSHWSAMSNAELRQHCPYCFISHDAHCSARMAN